MYYYNYEPIPDDDRTVKFQKQRKPQNLGFSYNDEYKNIRIDKIKGHLLDNIVEFNKNLTPDEINGTTVNNILKYNNLMSVSEFDKMLMAKQYQRLFGLSNDINEQKQNEYTNNKFSNLSLSEIGYNFSNVMLDLVNELPTAYKNKTINKEMFLREDRITYIGIFMITLSLMFYFMTL